MLELRRDDEIALTLVVDQGGLSVLLAAFGEALASGRSSVLVRLHPAVTKGRPSTPIDQSLSVVRACVPVPTLFTGEQGVSWTLGIEDLESGIEQLENAGARGYFAPAEFLRLQVAKRKKLDWIYAEYIADPEPTKEIRDHPSG